MYVTLFIAEVDNTTNASVISNSSGILPVLNGGSWQRDGQLAGIVIGILLLVAVLSTVVSFSWYLKHPLLLNRFISPYMALLEHLVLSSLISCI